MKIKIHSAALLILTLCAGFADTPELKQARCEKLPTADAVQIDTGFPYYAGRSPRSIANELEVNGIQAVYYFVILPPVMPGLIPELQSRGVPVALMTLPAMVYPSEAALDNLLPENWREWQVEFTDPARMSQYIFIGFNYPEYRAWYKPYLNKMLTDNNFDGFTFAEVMYPIGDGVEQSPPFYGDVSENFRRSFMIETGNDAFPDFSNPSSPHYFKTDTALYQALAAYRVKVVNEFYNDIINSPDGARAAVPNIRFATWTLGINLPDGTAKLREREGNDIASMIRLVRPDMHFIQTHAPDWSNPDLPPDYPLLYAPFFEEIRRAAPGVKVALQGDFGSLTATRRSPEWRRIFHDAAAKAGVDSTVWYEFSLRSEVYDQPPEPRKLTANSTNAILTFDHRLGPDAEKIMTGRRLGRAVIRESVVDGCDLICELDTPLYPGEIVNIDYSGVPDDPSVRFGDDTGPVNAAPEESAAPLKVLPRPDPAG